MATKKKRKSGLGLVKHDWRKVRSTKDRDRSAKRKQGTFTFYVERNHSEARAPHSTFVAQVCRAGKGARKLYGPGMQPIWRKNRIHPKHAGASGHGDTLCTGGAGKSPTAAVKVALLRFARALK